MNELRGKSVVDKCILGMKKKRDLTIIVLSCTNFCLAKTMN